MEIDYLNTALIVVAYLVYGLGMWSIIIVGFPSIGPIHSIFLVLVWPVVLLVVGLAMIIFVIIHFVIWSTDGLKSVDYKLAFSNSLKNVFKDRFFWGAMFGMILSILYSAIGRNRWVIVLVWVVVFFILNLGNEKRTE